MALSKMALNDDALDQVTGGTVVPYVTQPGDSWATLEAKYHVSAELIKKWNNLTGDTLPINKKLEIFY